MKLLISELKFVVVIMKLIGWMKMEMNRAHMQQLEAQ